MVIHNTVHHASSKAQYFKFTILRTIDGAMNRQIEEAMRIRHTSQSSILMNSGAEWRGDPIPRATFAVPSGGNARPVRTLPGC